MGCLFFGAVLSKIPCQDRCITGSWSYSGWICVTVCVFKLWPRDYKKLQSVQKKKIIPGLLWFWDADTDSVCLYFHQLPWVGGGQKKCYIAAFQELTWFCLISYVTHSSSVIVQKASPLTFSHCPPHTLLTHGSHCRWTHRLLRASHTTCQFVGTYVDRNGWLESLNPNFMPTCYANILLQWVPLCQFFLC